MFVVIMGCGRVGARLANLLEANGDEVVVLDTNDEAFGRLGSDFRGTKMLGNGVDMQVLRQAGIERADAFVACTQGDNRNIMASQIAKEIFNVSKVVTRIYDPIRMETFQLLGLDAISPTTIGAAALYSRVIGEQPPDEQI